MREYATPGSRPQRVPPPTAARPQLAAPGPALPSANCVGERAAANCPTQHTTQTTNPNPERDLNRLICLADTTNRVSCLTETTPGQSHATPFVGECVKTEPVQRSGQAHACESTDPRATRKSGQKVDISRPLFAAAAMPRDAGLGLRGPHSGAALSGSRGDSRAEPRANH